MLRVAPSFARVQRASPRAIAHRVLAGLGDRHFVRSIAFGPPPPISRQHTGYFGPGRHPPRNAIWAYLGAAASESFVGGFRVVSLWLLRPLQRAPLLVVETDRDRKSFVADVPSIVDWLDSRNGAAVTFEGFLLEARDAKGPFARVENVERGEAEGGQWSADPCDYPYAHSGPLSLRGNPC